VEELAFDDFSLWIEALDGGSGYRIRAHSPAGEVSETMSTLPVSARELSLPPAARDMSRDTPPSVRDIAAFQRPDYDVRRYGDELFRALLPGRVGLLLASSLGVLPDPRRGLRIKLHFDPTLPSAAALCSLPWELLYNAETKDYLGINPLTPLVRYLEVPRATQVGPFQPPLRILLVASNPAASPALDLRRERELIEQAWTRDREVVIQILERCDRESLREQLCDANFDVVHFMGHAAFDEATGTGALLLDGPRGHCEPVSGEVLADLLKGRLPRLVVLNACGSARALSGAGRDFFSGLAAAVVIGGVPAVVAMRAPVADSAAIRFSKALYGQLARGQAVDAAVAEGRRALYIDAPGSPAWATPVLFMRVPDGRLFAAPPQRDSGQRARPVDRSRRTDVRSSTSSDSSHTEDNVDFSILGTLDRGQINDILAQYKATLALHGEDADTHFSLGLVYLQLKLYDAAVKHFNRTIELAPENADGYYYCALALIRGRRPKVMAVKEIRIAEEYLMTALQLDDKQAKYFYLLGILRHDYYDNNGLRAPDPSPGDLFRRASERRSDPWEIERLLGSLTLRDDALIAQIRRD
jgi:tetratricopeptide (TPR) repeat protein